MSFIWFCAAGYSFFIGIFFIILVAAILNFYKKLWINLLIYILLLGGIFLIFMAAIPLPFFLYWALAIGVILELSIASIGSHKKKTRTLVTTFVLLISIIMVVIELSNQLKTSLPQQKYEKMYIIGDSVSAGIGGIYERPWPQILIDKYGVNIINLSVNAAKVKSAVRQAEQVDSDNALVLLEIGGNDFFAPTPPAEFEKHLRQILEMVTASSRKIVMLELPILPWQIKYGKIQRRLAREFDVVLIPKRFFVSILSSPGSTTDLAHLSSKGHQIMAEKMWSLFGYSLVPVNGELLSPINAP